ncbi:MAG: hypothetical protein V7L25_16935 [Nostoc sp.]
MSGGSRRWRSPPSLRDASDARGLVCGASHREEAALSVGVARRRHQLAQRKAYA